ncbi:MAG: hypothetical protein Q7J98_05645 [Kiritimatiellia bacterium]|nr:hypothetical protein [Kiritimatiellia bacterium]
MNSTRARLCVLLTGLTVLAFAFSQMASAADLYVATNGTGDGSSWANATNSIQGAIDAISGTYTTNTVWVSNGVYEVGGRTNYPSGGLLTNRVAIYKAITVRSANGPAVTTIKGAWDSAATTNGPAAVRCVYMIDNSTLIGFTLSNGTTRVLGTGIDNDAFGGGVFIHVGIISNCVITDNKSDYFGGGVFAWTSLDMYNCTLARNEAVRSRGGGACGGTYFNCTLVSNNTATEGGGAYKCTLYNCKLTANYAKTKGGGAYLSTIYNCTVVGNQSSGGGGVYTSSVYNSIVYFNSAVDGSSNWYNAVFFTNSCTAPTTTVWAAGNITSDPMLVDTNTANYRLSANSPCINAGINFPWMTDSNDVRSKDLDGRRRIDKFSAQLIWAVTNIYPQAPCFQSGRMLDFAPASPVYPG